MTASEFLTPEELAEVTGCRTARTQCAWLDENGWHYVKNRSGRPIVGRWAARMRLAGVQPSAAMVAAPREPNFAALD